MTRTETRTGYRASRRAGYRPGYRPSYRRRSLLPQALMTAALLAALAGATGLLLRGVDRGGDRLPAVPVPEPPAAAPAADAGAPAEDWMLRLVNRENPLPDHFEITLTELRNDQAVDSRCYPDLQAMMDDCRAAGLSPMICSSFRSREKQTRLYNNKVEQLLAHGCDEETAAAEAGQIVAVPGTSEHQLGLAVDIVDEDYQHLDEAQEDTAVQQWLLANSWEYGFILRYPTEKSDITGIIYEPWHYRYVGRDAAREIHSLGVCLEEYLAQ